MKTLTAKEISQSFGLVDQRVRRLGRELFGIDQQAGRSSGVARRFTIPETFTIYFAAILIDEHSFTMSTTAKMANLTTKLLVQEEFLPIEYWEFVTMSKVKEYGDITEWDLYLYEYSNFYDIKTGIFLCEVRGTIKLDSAPEIIECDNGYKIFTNKYASKVLRSDNRPKDKDSVALNIFSTSLNRLLSMFWGNLDSDRVD